MPIEETAENIAKLRSDATCLLKEIIDEVDDRDVERLKNEDIYVRFFLQWNKEMADAVKMVVKALKWRKEFGINDFTVQSLGEEQFKKGYFFVLGRALDGSRVLHFKTGQVEKKDRALNQKMVAFWFERIQRAEPGEKITILMDTTGSRLMNADSSFSTFIIDCCASYFPGMMKKIIIYNLPTLLNAFWKLVSKMLSQEQRDATALCSKADLLNHISKENLPEEMNGDMKFVYSFPPFPDDLKSPTS